MAPAPKDVRFELRMSAAEREMLREMAEEAGEGESIVLRQLIRQAFESTRAKASKKKR
jgi:hypothetical protein